MNTKEKILTTIELSSCPFCKKQFFGTQEIKILFAICIEGKTYQQIADELKTKTSAIRSQARNVKSKIQLNLEYFRKYFAQFDEFDLDKLGEFHVM